MNSAEKSRGGELVQMVEAYLAGNGRTRDFIREMEGKFAASGLDGDDRFSDLQYALAMFGARTSEHDEELLARACQSSVDLLRQTISG